MIQRLFFTVVFSALLLAAQSPGNATDADKNSKTLVWPDGTRYVGGVKDGKRSGKGTIFWQDGTRFVGEFNNDMRNGPGTMILPDGTVYSGVFKDDELISATAAAEVEPVEPDEMVGEVVDGMIAGAVKTEATANTSELTKSSSDATSEKIAAEAAADAEPAQIQDRFDAAVTALTPAVEQALIETIDLWAAAWSDKNTPQYLSNYSDDFAIPGKLSRRNWEGLRRSRLSRPSFINVDITYEKFELTGPDQVDVTFTQTYRSDIYSDVTNKILKMRKEGEHWKILVEASR